MFGICLLASITEGFDVQALAVSAPVMIGVFHLSKIELGWIFSVTNIGMTLDANFVGWLADRYGRRRSFGAAVAVFGASTLAIAHVPSFAGLVTRAASPGWASVRPSPSRY